MRVFVDAAAANGIPVGLNSTNFSEPVGVKQVVG